MTDPFARSHPSLAGPASAGFAVTPNDAADLPQITRALHVGGGGNLAVLMMNGEALTFTGVQDGSLLPVRVSRVLAAGTTATSIVGLY